MKLVLSIGNSTLKFAKIVNHKIQDVKILLWKNNSEKIEFKNEILTFLKQKCQNIFVISVVKKYTEFLKDSSFKEKIIFIDSYFAEKAINFEKINRKQIGADIVTSAAYLALEYKIPSILISFGTLTVISLVKNNNLIGVAIAPSILTIFKSISKSADLISVDKKSTSFKTLDVSTESAITSGATNMFAFYINNMITKIIKEFNLSEFNVITTGGYYHTINGLLDFEHKHIDLLEIEGLNKLLINS